jgi:hypothetical protein
MEDKIKLYTFGIRDKKGRWHYLTERYKLYQVTLREAYYDTKVVIEESAKFILEHISSDEFDLETARIFESTVKAMPFNFKRNIK